MPPKKKKKDSTPSGGKKDDGGEVSGDDVGSMAMVGGNGNECVNG